MLTRAEAREAGGRPSPRRSSEATHRIRPVSLDVVERTAIARELDL